MFLSLDPIAERSLSRANMQHANFEHYWKDVIMYEGYNSVPCSILPQIISVESPDTFILEAMPRINVLSIAIVILVIKDR